jgi:hypothetical protein
MGLEIRTRETAQATAETSDAGTVSTRDWLQERIDGRLAAGIGIAWLVAYQIASSLEPVTHKPEPWYGVVLNIGLLGLIAVTATGLVMQRRWGLAMSVAAALAFTALSVACPVSGHHPFGAWWFGQMACALGMVGASLFALTRPARVELLSAGDAASRD